MHKLSWVSLTVIAVAAAVTAAGCGAPAPTVPPVEEPRTPAVASETSSPRESGPQTAAPFALDLTPLPTATALPPLELPTLPPFPQDLQVWDGLPTYPAESRADFYFRVHYDPRLWALTVDPLGQRVLASRTLTGCQLAASAGRGLPPGSEVVHEVLDLGRVTFQVSKVSLTGSKAFANYAGGDGVIYTAFEVLYGADSASCVAAAETVLGTLRAVPTSEATLAAP